MLELILGIGIVSFILVYTAFKLDKVHFGLKILFVFIALILMILIPKTIIDDYDHCNVYPVNETVNGNLTMVDYQRICFSNENKTDTTFYNAYWFILITSLIYLFIYMSYYYMNFAKKLNWKGRK